MTLNPLSPAEIVLTSLRADTTLEQKALQLTGLPAEAWQQAVQFASTHEVLPLLSPRWRQLAPQAGIPDQTLRAAQAIYLHNRVRNGRMLEGLGQILAVFQKEAIQVIVLKGAHLAQSYYDDPALRPMSDLDLLIWPDDLPRARRAITQIGYEAVLGAAGQEEYGKHLQFRHVLSDIEVELHWQLLSKEFDLKPSPEVLWLQAVPATLSGQPALILPAESILAFFALHLYSHHFQVPLRMVWDAAVVVHKSTIDWPVTLELAQQWQLARSLTVLLWLIKDLWGSDVAPVVISNLENGDVVSWGKTARQNILKYRQEDMPMVSPSFLHLWSGKQGLLQKMDTIRQRIFPDRLWMAMHYQIAPDDSKILIAYLKRLIALPISYGKATWNMLGGDVESKTRLMRQKELIEWLSSEADEN